MAGKRGAIQFHTSTRRAAWYASLVLILQGFFAGVSKPPRRSRIRVRLKGEIYDDEVQLDH